MIVQLVKTDDAKQELTIPEATSTTDGVMSATDKLNLDDAVNSIVSTIGKYDITLRVSKNNGNSYSVVLPSATVRTAGLMTASDKFNLDDAVSYVDAEGDEEKFRILFYKSNEANGYDYIDIPLVAETSAGLMSATMLTALKAAYSIVGSTMDESSVSLQLTRLSGDITNITVKEATTATAGVMSATDKSNLDNSIYAVAQKVGEDAIVLTAQRNDGGEVQMEIPAATLSTAGLMTASDTLKLDNVYTGLQSLTKRVEKLEKSGGGGGGESGGGGDCDCESITDEELEELLS